MSSELLQAIEEKVKGAKQGAEKGVNGEQSYENWLLNVLLLQEKIKLEKAVATADSKPRVEGRIKNFIHNHAPNLKVLSENGKEHAHSKKSKTQIQEALPKLGFAEPSVAEPTDEVKPTLLLEPSKISKKLKDSLVSWKLRWSLWQKHQDKSKHTVDQMLSTYSFSGGEVEPLVFGLNKFGVLFDVCQFDFLKVDQAPKLSYLIDETKSNQARYVEKLLNHLDIDFNVFKNSTIGDILPTGIQGVWLKLRPKKSRGVTFSVVIDAPYLESLLGEVNDDDKKQYFVVGEGLNQLSASELEKHIDNTKSQS